MSQLTGEPGRPTRRTGSPWILPALLVALIAIPIIELWVLLQVGRVIGAVSTILILIAEAALGSWLLKREGNRAWEALRKAFESGRMPTGELASAALVLVGGVLLIVPGFVTDIVGLFFLLPFTRPLARRLLGLMIASRVRRAGVDVDLIRAKVDQSNTIRGETAPDNGAGPSAQERRSGSSRASQSDDPTVIQGEIEP